MALINKPNYSHYNLLKIDDLIDPRMNTVSSILKHVHKGQSKMHTLYLMEV